MAVEYINVQCQCQYEIYIAPITKRTWVYYIVTELVNSCYIVLKAKLKQCIQWLFELAVNDSLKCIVERSVTIALSM